MAFSSSAKLSVGVLAETVYGTTPATPQLVEIPVSDISLDETWTEILDTSKQTDRQERYVVKGNKQVSGSVGGDLAHANHDILLESLLYGAFATNVLKPGSTRKSFVLETFDSVNTQYRYANGVLVDSLSIDVPLDGPVTFDAKLVAKSLSAFSGTSIDSTGYTAAPLKTPLLTVETTGFIKEGGVAAGFIQNAKFTISNNLDVKYALGSRDAVEVAIGKLQVTGEITCYFDSPTVFNKCRNSTASSLDFKFSDGTNTIQLFVPNVRYTKANVVTSGDKAIEVKMTFRGLYDATSAANLVITRS